MQNYITIHELKKIELKIKSIKNDKLTFIDKFIKTSKAIFMYYSPFYI